MVYPGLEARNYALFLDYLNPRGGVGIHRVQLADTGIAHSQSFLPAELDNTGRLALLFTRGAPVGGSPAVTTIAACCIGTRVLLLHDVTSDYEVERLLHGVDVDLFVEHAIFGELLYHFHGSDLLSNAFGRS